MGSVPGRRCTLGMLVWRLRGFQNKVHDVTRGSVGRRETHHTQLALLCVLAVDTHAAHKCNTAPMHQSMQEHKNIPYIVALLGLADEQLFWGAVPDSGVRSAITLNGHLFSRHADHPCTLSSLPSHGAERAPLGHQANACTDRLRLQCHRQANMPQR